MSGKLGRLLEHDPRSKDFPAKVASEVKTVSWKRHTKAYDQGSLGSCTGNAMAGALMTDGLWNGKWYLRESNAVTLYSLATHLDGIQDPPYKPDDRGSSGLGVAKAAKEKKYINSYQHAFGLDHFLGAIQLGPVIVGMDWLTGCDHPDSSGLVQYTGTVRGGHEIECFGVDMENKLVWFWNSWGASWGKGGTFTMSIPDFDKALKAQGDVTVPSLDVVPSPES